MTKSERYNLIKKICEHKNQIDEYGQLPTTEADLQDEFARFNTTVERLDDSQNSERWQSKFLQDLIFGTS